MDAARNRFMAWLFSAAEVRRCEHEWAKWDGTQEHGNAINDAQCARIDAAKARLDCPHGLMTDEEIARIAT